MAESLGCSLVACGRPIGVHFVGFVKTETTATCGTFICGEKLDCFFRQDAVAAILSAVEPHLTHFGNIVGIREQSCIALNTARESGGFVVVRSIRALDGLSAVSFSVGAICDLLWVSVGR